jgi:hypothetical protein
MTEPSENNLIEAAHRLRRESERALDELTIARLRAARLNAIATVPRRFRGWGVFSGVATAGLALAVAGLIWFQTPSEKPLGPDSGPTLADLDLLTTETPEFYSNLEFYQWLASQSDSS